MQVDQYQPNSLTPQLAIYTLGRFAIRRGQVVIAENTWNRQKAKQMFKLLLVSPNYKLLKEKAVEWLWPDKHPKKSNNNLHRTLYVLRRILQPELQKGENDKI